MDYGFTKFLSRAMNNTDFKLNIAYAKIAQRKINLYLLKKSPFRRVNQVSPWFGLKFSLLVSVSLSFLSSPPLLFGKISHVAQTSLQIYHPPASASQVLGL